MEFDGVALVEDRMVVAGVLGVGIPAVDTTPVGAASILGVNALGVVRWGAEETPVARSLGGNADGVR